MSKDNIASIVDSRKKNVENNFFLIVTGSNMQEDFLELRHMKGMKTCFPYNDITFFNYDPQGKIDIEFNGFRVKVIGRGLDRLFQGIKARQVAWIQEAESEMQDNKDNDSFVSEITIEDSVAPGEGETEKEEKS